jgi:antitoxin HicB
MAVTTEETAMRYPVTITKDDNDTYLVSFPDVPEAVTFGDTREEALAHAQDALLTVFDAYIRERKDIPAASNRGTSFVELPALETTKVELYRAMREQEVGKTELAKRLDWHLPQVDRVLNVRHGSQLDQLEAAFSALGKKLVLNVVDTSTGPSLHQRPTARKRTYRRVTSSATVTHTPGGHRIVRHPGTGTRRTARTMRFAAKKR